MTTPGQRVAQEVYTRLDKLQFYVDCLTNIERSKLAARYLRKIHPNLRLYLLRCKSIPELALLEVISRETYGW